MATLIASCALSLASFESASAFSWSALILEAMSSSVEDVSVVKIVFSFSIPITRLSNCAISSYGRIGMPTVISSLKLCVAQETSAKT